MENLKDDIVATLIAMERAALDRWGDGDPSGYLEISAPDVVYFDPFIERRLDGLEALTRWYELLRGKIHVDHYEFFNPEVQVCGEAAVLTFNLVSHEGAENMRWNCTEVYRHDAVGWRIVQTHWSFTQPNQASEMPKTLLEMAGAKQQAARLSDSVLVIIDEQREYVDGKLPLSGINNAIKESAKLLARARKSGTPVIHVVHHGRKGGELFNPDEKFVEIVAPLTPVSGEQIVVKSLPDAFSGTSLEGLIQRTGRTELIVIGFMTHMCVSSTVRTASSRGYKITVVASATATRDLSGVDGSVIHAADVQRANLAALSDMFAVVVVDTDEIK